MKLKSLLWFFVIVMLSGLCIAGYQVVYNPLHDSKMQYVQDPASMNANSSNSSNYWDGLNTPADINAGDITDDNTYVRVSGDTMLGNINMNSNNITNIKRLFGVGPLLFGTQSTSHSLTASGSIVVNSLEVNNKAYFDDGSYFGNINVAWVNSSLNVTSPLFVGNLSGFCSASNTSNYWDENDVPSDLNNRIIVSAVNVTSGTFGTGNYVMDQNLTVQGLVLEKDAGHVIYDNTTCIIFKGDTSNLYLC